MRILVKICRAALAATVLVGAASACGDDEPGDMGDGTATAIAMKPAEATETAATPTAEVAAAAEIVEYAVPAGSRPHDVAPAPDGSVWYTAQGAGALGRLDPLTGATEQIALGAGSAPHGVISGPTARRGSPMAG